jgi:hypothetical protein
MLISSPFFEVKFGEVNFDLAEMKLAPCYVFLVVCRFVPTGDPRRRRSSFCGLYGEPT